MNKLLELLTEQNIALMTLVLSGLLSAISGILELSGKTGLSKVIGTVSVADIGRVLRFVKRFLDERKAAKVAKVTSIMLAFLVLPGCTGTFEEARLAQPGALQASPVRVASSRCVALSDREYWFGVTAIGSGSTGVGAVITAIPASDKYETALVIAGASAAAVSVVSELASSKAGELYVKEGCAK
jgi:hypothetical protein